MSCSTSAPEVSEEDALNALNDITNDSSNNGGQPDSKETPTSNPPSTVSNPPLSANATQPSNPTANGTGGENTSSSTTQLGPSLSTETVERLLRRTKWSGGEKKRVLRAYGFKKYKDMLAFRTKYLSCEKSYAGILHALYVKLKLKGKADLESALSQGVLKTADERFIVVNGKQVPFSLMYGLARVDAEKECIELAKLVAPLETGNPERIQTIRNLFETQSELKLKDGKKELKLQYFGKMMEYVVWVLHDFHLEDECGNKVPVTLPLSKHLYGVEFIKSKLRDDANDGRGYSASTIKHCVQALNQIWQREHIMYPDLINYETPGDNKVFKTLIQKSRRRKNQRAIDNFDDRGLDGHLNQMKKEDLLTLEHFVLSYHPDLVDSYTADEFRDMGLPISTDPTIEAARVKQIKSCLRQFATDYEVICHNAMFAVCTNTYVRGQQARGCNLADVSIRECPEMGSTGFPGFKPPILIVLGINVSKNSVGDKVEYTYVARHLDVLQCGTSKLAFYIVMTFSDLNGENQVRKMPDLSVNKNWYEEMLFCPDPSDPNKMFGWKEQAVEVERMQKILGIQTTGVVHATRHFMDMNEAPPQDVARLSLYQAGMGVMEKVYLHSPPCRAIRGRTGFAWQGTEWFLPRQALWIDDLSAEKDWKVSRDSEYHLVRDEEVKVKNGPNSFRKVIKHVRKPNYYLLVLEIFPFLPGWKKVFDLAWIASNPEKTYLAAQGFVSFVEYMAIVFLQDAVVQIEDYPDFCLFQHKVFKHPLWEEFKEESQTLMKGLECVAAFKPVSRSHAPEVQAELEQLHSSVRASQSENVDLKNHVARLSTELSEMRKAMALQMKNMSTTLGLVQKQNALLGQQTNDKLDRLLGSASSAPTSATRSIEPSTCSNAVSSPKPEAQQPPSKRRRYSPAEASAQLVLDSKRQYYLERVNALEAAKPFLVPLMKTRPRAVYEAFYVKRYGSCKGLLEVNREAVSLGVTKEDLFKMPTTAALEAKTGKKAKKSTAPRRFRELQRVAELYKSCYDDRFASAVVPAEHTLAPEEHIHGLALEEFIKRAISLGGVYANFEAGKSSLQKLCNVLQANANPHNGKRGRPSTKKDENKAVAEDSIA